ncbi:hypothetical protein PG987_015430 [Apiospora arundinis]|uniref:Uncharacterized protein n=1 Tax=Apiospora arundinis TaxID=335852 RepID=A0ABR2HSA1_9PEZI
MADQSPATSGDLKYRAMRRWSRIKKCEPIVAEIIANTPELAGLDEEKKAKILKEVKDYLYEDVTNFMDSTAPRSIYPMKEAVGAALKSIFYWNEDVFGIKWREDLLVLD